MAKACILKWYTVLFCCTVPHFINVREEDQCNTAHSQSSPLIPQRLDIIHLLHSLCSEYERMLFLYANAIFDADAHAAEVGRVSFRVGNVDAASTSFISRV